jgi:hypothetical protein
LLDWGLRGRMGGRLKEGTNMVHILFEIVYWAYVFGFISSIFLALIFLASWVICSISKRKSNKKIEIIVGISLGLLFTVTIPIWTKIVFDSVPSYPNDPNYPGDPNSYFNDERQDELTRIAEEILHIQDENSMELIREKLKKHHLKVKYANSKTGIVDFGFYYRRTWYSYIYSKSELPEIYSTKPVITEDDIMHWGELVSIIKTENDLSKYSRENTSFNTEIVYPFLVTNLEKGLVDKLSGLPPIEDHDTFMSKNKDIDVTEAIKKRWSDYEIVIANKLSEEDRIAIAEVLNKHCRIQSKLIEDENITWIPSSWRPGEKALMFCGYNSISSSFQVNKHLEQLISDGVIRVKDKAGHLEVKANLSDKEKLEIEWLQLEIMRFVYGNLVRKTTYWSNGKIRLSNNWYFHEW